MRERARKSRAVNLGRSRKGETPFNLFHYNAGVRTKGLYNGNVEETTSRNIFKINISSYTHTHITAAAVTTKNQITSRITTRGDYNKINCIRTRITNIVNRGEVTARIEKERFDFLETPRENELMT